MIMNWHGTKVYITGWEPEAPECCEFCGKKEDNRPFGPNGEWICCDCAEKDVKTTEKMMREAMKGSEITISFGCELKNVSKAEVIEMLDNAMEATPTEGEA
jgi:hypothetical protein